MRKTLNREVLVSTVNRALATEGLTADQRQVLSDLASAVLLTGDSYAGFRYQASELAEQLDGEFGLRADYDDTRRVYL